jgi:hypothetical protein
MPDAANGRDHLEFMSTSTATPLRSIRHFRPTPDLGKRNQIASWSAPGCEKRQMQYQ